MKKPLSIPKQQINMQFKLLSAIAIIIIVAGHCYKGGLSLAYEWFPPYSYNIALLVFISGYFYKSEYEKSALKYIWKRTKRLLVPAYIWNIIYGLFILLMNCFGYTIGGEINAYNLFVMPFVDGEAFQYNLGSWFVYPLFAVCVINVLFRKLLKLINLDNEILITILYFIAGIIGIQLAINLGYGSFNGLLKLALRSMFFMPCYQLGRLYKVKLEVLDRLSSIAYFAVLFTVQLLIITFFGELEYTPSDMCRFSNGCVIPYITAITGIAFWLRISKLLTPIVRNWRFIRLISDNTYSIMIHQLFGFMCVKWFFLLLSTATPLFSDFNVQLLKSSIWYYYLPKGLNQWAMLYLACGIFVPILIKKLCSTVYEAAGFIGSDLLKKFKDLKSK